MKIKFSLVKLEKALAFQILEQSPEITGRDQRSKILFSNKDNIFHIYSQSEPAFSGSFKRNDKHAYLYLRGERTVNDLKVVIINLDDNELRDELYNLILNGLQNMNV